MTRQLIVGNWKMNGLGEAAGRLAETLREALAQEPAEAQVAICPPFTQLAPVGAVLRGSAVALGAQDCHTAANGAHTGDISAPMLADLGCRHVVLGHSERRANHGETDALVRAKTEAAQAAGLIPIVCVGEDEAQREGGQEVAVVSAQLAGSLPDTFSGVIAYEPVWAIGTGKTAQTSDVEAMHAAIRAVLTRRFGAAGAGISILYGGSVKAANAESLLAVREVGGALVGGASLDAKEFLSIIRAAAV